MFAHLHMATARLSLAALIAALSAAPVPVGQQTSPPPDKPTSTSTTSGMVVPLCAKLAKHYRRIGWGNAGLHYDVPKSGVKVLGGKPDVDYVEYVIRPKDSQGWLQLWFGGLAMPSTPSEDPVAKSSQLSKRNVLNAKGELAGFDSSGVLKNGERWRVTAVTSNGGSIYRTVSPTDAALFDRIVNSMCEVPSRR